MSILSILIFINWLPACYSIVWHVVRIWKTGEVICNKFQYVLLYLGPGKRGIYFVWFILPFYSLFLKDAILQSAFFSSEATL